MSGYIRREDRLFDPTTGALVGYIDANGNEQVGYPVSVAGNLASAAIATEQGTALGDTRRISDGSDQGAILMWAIPSGGSVPAWCWWLWPQSAYSA